MYVIKNYEHLPEMYAHTVKKHEFIKKIFTSQSFIEEYLLLTIFVDWHSVVPIYKY